MRDIRAAGRRYASLLLLAIMACTVLGLGTAQAEPVAFYVMPAFPENQTDASLGYYSLKVTPGQKQTISLQVVNNGDEDLTVEVLAFDAISNANGQVSYAQEIPAVDAGARPYLFSDLVKPVDPVVTIAAHSAQTVQYSIEMPEESFDGVVHGAVLIRQLPQAEGTEEAALRIVNAVTYQLGMRLTETDAVLEPELVLREAQLNVRTEFGQVLRITLENPVQMILGGVQATVGIYAEGAAEPVYTYEGRLSFAAGSTMPLEILVPERFATGSYVVRVNLAYEDLTWQLSLPVTVE